MRQKGEKSHLWKGGRTDEALLVRLSAGYRDWRNAVFGRDNYTCCLCGGRGGRLTAHHIKLFSAHVDLRLVVSNGVTLCWDCHGTIRTREADYEDRFNQHVASKAA